MSVPAHAIIDVFAEDRFEAIELFAGRAASLWGAIGEAAGASDLDAIGADLERVCILVEAVALTIEGPAMSGGFPPDFGKAAREWREERDKANPLRPLPAGGDVWKAERRAKATRKADATRTSIIKLPEGFPDWPPDKQKVWVAEADRLKAAQKDRRS